VAQVALELTISSWPKNRVRGIAGEGLPSLAMPKTTKIAMKKKSLQTLQGKALGTAKQNRIRGGGIHLEDLVIQ